MWDLLKPSDIEQAKEALLQRRAATLQRQRDDIARLAADRETVETLDRLADAFCQKYRQAATAPAPAESAAAMPAEPAPEVPPSEPEPEPEPEIDAVEAEAAPAGPIAAAKRAELPPPIFHAREKRSAALARLGRSSVRTGTNFDIFSRAVSKSTF